MRGTCRDQSGGRIGSGRLGALAGLALGLGLALGAPAAHALTIGFDGLASLSDVATASLPGVSVSTALVVSEADAALLTSFDTSKWAISDPNGILNTLAPSISFDFATPVSAFSVNVVALPDAGAFQQVLLQAYRGATLIGMDFSDPGLIGDSGFAEDLLSVSGLNIDRVVLSPVTPTIQNGVPCFDLGQTTTFFADDVSFTPVPEPGTAGLLLFGLAGMAARSLRTENA